MSDPEELIQLRRGHRGSRRGAMASVVAAALALATSLPTARAERATNSFLSANESKVHVALGPTVAGIHQDEGWDSQVGGEIHLVRLAPSLVHAQGATLGVLSFASSKTLRLYSEGYLGLRLTSDLSIGLSAGPIVDVHPNRRARVGAQAGLWLHAGVAPYLTVARTWGTTAPDHTEVAIGLRIPFSIADF